MHYDNFVFEAKFHVKFIDITGGSFVFNEIDITKYSIGTMVVFLRFVEIFFLQRQ